MNEQVTLQEKLQAAMEADAKGIPVSWKEMCVETYNVAMAEIQRLTALIPEDDEVTGTDQVGLSPTSLQALVAPVVETLLCTISQ